MLASGLRSLRSLRYTLKILEVDSLLPHEEVVLSSIEKLALDIQKDGLQKDPIIVDASTRTVLDGMHRLAALKSIGCRMVLACSLNYRDSSVRVGRWVRCLESLTPRFLSRLKERLQLTEASRRDSLSQVESLKSPVALITSSVSYVSKLPFKSVLEAYLLVGEFDKTSENMGENVRILPESEGEGRFGSAHVAYLKTPPVGKEDVIAAAQTRRLFPHKSTRHVIVLRPVNARLPLELLKGGVSSEQISAFISKKRYEILEPGSIYEGKIFEESLLLFREDA